MEEFESTKSKSLNINLYNGNQSMLGKSLSKYGNEKQNDTSITCKSCYATCLSFKKPWGSVNHLLPTNAC